MLGTTTLPSSMKVGLRNADHPQPSYETTPRHDLIIEVMLMIDEAIEGREEVSTWNLAEQIVDLVDPPPVDPPTATSASTKGLNPTLLAMVKDSREKYAP